MKHRIYTFALIAAVCTSLTACSSGNTSSTVTTTAPVTTQAPAASAFNVSFDLNYDGAPAAEVVSVEAENAPEQPEDPTRAGYAFQGWFSDAEGTQEADFEVAILADTTYFAGWEKTQATVTFNLNGAEGDDIVEEVELRGTAQSPAAPVREGYLFTAWYTDEDCTTVYDFSSEVSEDLVLYAGWEEDTGNNFSVTFDWNYEDKGTYSMLTVKKLGYAAEPSLAMDGFYLEGWYTDADCTEKFDFTTRIRESMTLYANWLKTFTFEAEYTDLTGLEGMGYSGNASGTKMIEDGKERGASNNAYVGWLYNEGLTLTFNLNSTEADSAAYLALNLSAEFYDITLTSSNFTVAVNGQPVSYKDIAFEGVTVTDLPFRTYVLDQAVELQEGENVITLSVTNNEKKTGTIYATAPMVDALQVYSKADVTWAEGFPMTDNIQ